MVARPPKGSQPSSGGSVVPVTPVAFLPAVDRSSAAPDGNCVLAVTVYADRADRLELWNTFFADVSSFRVTWVTDKANGDVIPLHAWGNRARRR